MSSLQEKIAKLKARFVAQLPERLDKIQHTFALLETEGITKQQLTELHLLLHSLKGTGLSFGFEDLAKLAGEAEQLSQNMLQQEVTGLNTTKQQWLATITPKLAALATQIQLAIELHTQLPEVQLEPFFELKPHSLSRADIAQPLVYLCDDEPEQVSYLEQQLRCFGYTVQHFTTTQSFHKAVITKQPDAIVMDVQFPEGRTAGTEEIAKIQQLVKAKIPAVVLSGRDDFEARLSAIRAGCSAYFLKPAKPLELASSLDTLIKKPNSQPFKILLVDDDPLAAEYHSNLLEEAGMQVQQLHQPERILEALRTFGPDLVLADMYMPVCDGVEMTALIRQLPEYLSLPIIFLSSETDRQKQIAAMQVGAEGFITKPVVPEELVALVSLRAERMLSLRALMTRDSLTGLYNHTTTNELNNQALNQAIREQTSLALVMLDLDKFKLVNDTYGHMAGDQVLIALARLLKSRLRSTDVIGRFGGEEFVVLLNKVNVNEAQDLVDDLRQTFSQIVFTAGKHNFNVTFSAGISMYPKYPNLVELSLAADAAMYTAKNSGRNQVVVA